MNRKVIIRPCEGNTGRLTAEVKAEKPYRKVRFEIFSNRNDRISRMSDISEFDPDQTPGTERYSKNLDIWFPVVDIGVEPSMYGKAVIEGAETCHINSYFNFDETRVEEQNAIFSPAVLTHWENGLWIGNKDAFVRSFAMVKESFAVPSISQYAACEFTPLTEDWGGRVRVYFQGDDGTWMYYGEGESRQKKRQDFGKTGSGSLEEAVNLCIDYLMNSVNHSVNNPYNGGLYLFYDWDSGCYRNGQWPWSWGPAIRFLLECAGLAEKPDGIIKIHRPAEELRQTARRIGEVTLKFQICQKGHPADGFGTTRYTPRNFSDVGYQELINSGSDTGFLCGWGWMPLYHETGQRRYLDAAKTYLKALDRLLKQFIIPPQEWLPAGQDWTEFTIDESGFGTEGIEAVYRTVGDEFYKELCSSYMDRHLQIFEREDGLWERQYNFKTGSIEPTIYMTRGLGWAMEGLLAAYRCCPERKDYLEKAEKMADILKKHQREDGSWGFCFRDKDNRQGTADKGTALWCLLFYMLYRENHKERYLETARKALAWCMRNQYTGENVHARGGIISVSGESGVTYRSYFRLCCQYTTAFLGLALLEEVKWEEMYGKELE